MTGQHHGRACTAAQRRGGWQHIPERNRADPRPPALCTWDPRLQEDVSAEVAPVPPEFRSGKGGTRVGPRGGGGTWQRARARVGPWKVLGSGVPKTHPLSWFPFQFDLQRTVIYCDSRHAELETCCDIPSGPVSNDTSMERRGQRRGFRVLGPGREEASGV